MSAGTNNNKRFCANVSTCVHMYDKQSKYTRSVLEGGKRPTFFIFRAIGARIHPYVVKHACALINTHARTHQRTRPLELTFLRKHE